MNMLTKISIVLALAVGIFLGGYYAGKGQKEIQIVEKTVKGEDVIKTVEKVITVIKTIKPDGTITEEKKSESRDIAEKIKYVDREKLVYTKPVLSNYSLGVMVTKSFKDFDFTDPRPDYSITAGYRAIGEFWVDSAYTPSTQTVSLGLSFKF